MRRGFLSAPAAERVWVSTEAGGIACHIGNVLKRSGDRVKLELLADGVVRTLRANEVHRLPENGPQVLTTQVKLAEPELTRLLGAWGQTDRATGAPLHLPPELVAHVIGFLEVPRVQMAAVRAVSCSSIFAPSEDCSLEASLDASCNNWWISADGSFKGGCGSEWVEFALGEGARRVELVELRIPPLPSGPLSVRTFHIETRETSGAPWARASRDFSTLDSDGAQSFHIEPPVEASSLRLVCTRNAARARHDEVRAKLARAGRIDPSLESDEDGERALATLPSSVGFFSVAFR